MARGRWVKREGEAARYLGGLRVTKRFHGDSCPDIRIPGHENLNIDLKNGAGFRHHPLLETIERRYVRWADEEAVLITWDWNVPVECMVVRLSKKPLACSGNAG